MILDPENAKRLIALVKKNATPPEQITKLREQIDSEIHAAQQLEIKTGVIDLADVQKIVVMKRNLDQLYALWAKGKLP